MTQQTWFYVGGTWQSTQEQTFLSGQMYVQRFRPDQPVRQLPVVMIHGGVQSGTCFEATADGRRGWAGDFVEAGYTVYVIDQPERGRSGHRLAGSSTQPMQRYSAERIERIFTSTATAHRWPRANRHSQWPGSGSRGDPVFDNFFASQLEMLVDRTEIERTSVDALIALLDQIGEAIVLTHSQSGPMGWLLADARPQQVVGIVAIEPNGPPFHDVQFLGAPDWFACSRNNARPWGITRLPLTFEPSFDGVDQLRPIATEQSDGEFVSGLVPEGPRRKLIHLIDTPIAIVSAEASFHACYDQCTSEFLRWAGVDNDYIRLESRGIYGNGHMMMLEKNSRAISELLINWLTEAGL